MLDIFVKLNFTKAQININKRRSNNIAQYVAWLHVSSVGLLRIVFFYHITRNLSIFPKLLAKLQSTEFVTITHKSYINIAIKILCGTSLAASLLIAILGLDAVHYYIVKTEGWTFHDVALQRDENIVSAFSRLRFWYKNAENHTLNTPMGNQTYWTPMNIILGTVGISWSFCGLFLTSSINDIFLATTVMLAIATKNMHLDEGEVGRDDMNLAETQALFNAVVKRFKKLAEISESMNEFVGRLIPFIAMMDALIIVSYVNESLEGNWSIVTCYSFGLVKDITAICFATSIAAEVRK